MSPARKVHVVEDTRFREHVAPPGHPERPERLVAVSRAIARFGDRIGHRPPEDVDPEAILRVHGRAHLHHVEDVVARAPAHLDADTFVSPESLHVARLAAGSTVAIARSVARGEITTGLAAVRPPGHHAEADRAMGFCLFNNVAVAARALQADEGVGKLLVIDWDVHHGNGTQHSFESDPSILYFSTHQYPHYPGTGAFGEVGVGAGEGATVNVPMPAGCGDSEYVGVFARILAPVARVFAPEMILVSCGFDAHRDDPLASMQVGTAGYRDMTRIVRAVAEDVCGGRLAFVLEGGYAASGLDEGTSAVLDALLEPTPKLPATPAAEPGTMLRALIRGVEQAHGGRFPGLGAA
jgi:acetoin utilization deacetylase AcuC-like enzyme